MKFTNFLLTLILIALGLIGYKLYFGDTNPFMAQKQQEPQIVPAQTKESMNDTPTDKMTMQEQDSTGTVTGKLCYPAEGIPPLEVRLKPTNSATYTAVNTQQNQQTFTFEDVAPGTYVAYAYNQGNTTFGGGYTPAVACGLSVNCTDHSLIEFAVQAGQTTNNVDVCDWYGAELP